MVSVRAGVDYGCCAGRDVLDSACYTKRNGHSIPANFQCPPVHTSVQVDSLVTQNGEGGHEAGKRVVNEEHGVIVR